MNATIRNINSSRTLVAVVVASALLTACATAPSQPAGAAEVRSKLSQLQADPNLGSRAPIAIKEAEIAVLAAEQPQSDASLAQHRVYMADRKVETARAQAETRFAEDQRPALSQQRERARLDSRTREADAARTQVAVARADSAEQKLAAEEARGAANDAQVAAMMSERQAAELQRQIDELNARPTDRGLVVTLGDVLFVSGQADLKGSATGNLNKLAAFLNEYPSRTVVIEGHTDSVGSEDYNQGLSQRRADSVKTYLVGQGIGSARLAAAGKGENAPVAVNDSAAGRQQNRRVEVIIDSPPGAALR
jgi:outer membrane protein OmpA-like peptidoglycan-associated protein